MGGCLKWMSVIVLVTAVLLGLTLTGIFDTESKAPDMKPGWWGKGPPKEENDTAQISIVVKFPDGILQDLTARLNKARFAEDLENGNFQYGFQSNYLRDVVLPYWRTKFDWRKQENILNIYKHYKTKIEGISVHYLRASPPEGKVGKPLLMVHGWPGSVWEFYKIIPMLINPQDGDDNVFEVICPSIPGYGFSEAPHQKGFDPVAAARIMNTLMKRLGYDKYYYQGGDWGAFIGEFLSQAYPESVQGLHLNVVNTRMFTPSLFLKQLLGGISPSLVMDPKEAHKVYPFWDKVAFLLRESGYFHQQATRPDTVGVGLTDSPIGLAAYIMEKFASWTNPEDQDQPNGGLTKHFALDDLLTNVMIYWATGSITSSMRFYKEAFARESAELDPIVPETVPTGLACFPKEISCAPRAFASYKYKNIVQHSDMPAGGHFAAFEQPKILAEDFRSFVKKVELQITESEQS